jgi:hypothetical protein
MSAPGNDTDVGRIPDADWITAGFRWSTQPGLKDGQAGLWQRRVRDYRGTAYFVTVFAWDWREFRVRGCPYDWSYGQQDHFQRGDDHFNVSRSVKSPADALAFAAEIWAKLGCDYYELDEPTPTLSGQATDPAAREETP